jgi:hypothetical protein
MTTPDFIITSFERVIISEKQYNFLNKRERGAERSVERWKTEL